MTFKNTEYGKPELFIETLDQVRSLKWWDQLSEKWAIVSEKWVIVSEKWEIVSEKMTF